MTTIKLPYIDRFRDASGVWRYYFRRSRKHPRIPLSGRPGEPAFMRAYELALANTDSKRAGDRHAIAPGSFDALADAYYRSASFMALRKSTQSTYRGIIERFRATEGKNGLTYGRCHAALLKRRRVNELLTEKMETGGPWAANNLLKVLRVMFHFAVDNDWCSENPTLGVKPIRAKSDGFESWSEDHITKFEQCYESGTRERLALYLLLYTGQRRGDVVSMGRQHIAGDLIRVKQSKTSRRLVIPMHDKLRAEIAANTTSSEHLTFLLNRWGRPFTAAGFGNWFRKVCDGAGLQGLSAHGLRKAAARRLAEAGCTPHEIQAITGHKTLAEVSRYTEAASQERLARDAMKRMRDAEGD